MIKLPDYFYFYHKMVSNKKFIPIYKIFDDEFKKIDPKKENLDELQMSRVLTVLKNEFSDDEITLIPKIIWKATARALWEKIGHENVFGADPTIAEAFFRDTVRDIVNDRPSKN